MLAWLLFVLVGQKERNVSEFKAGDMVVTDQNIAFLIDAVNVQTCEAVNVCGNGVMTVHHFDNLRPLRTCDDEASKYYLHYIIRRECANTAGVWARENLRAIDRREQADSCRKSDPKPTSGS